MKNVFGPFVLAGLVQVGALPALAQTDVLPTIAYDNFAVISYVTTAGSECDGAQVDDKTLRREMTNFMEVLQKAGIDPVAAVKHLETEAGAEQLQLREASLRARHGVDAEGYPALCAAIAAESASNEEFRKLVQFK